MNSNETNSNEPKYLGFAATGKYIEENIIKPTERVVGSNSVVEWGDGNAYPDYLLALFKEVPTLHSIITGNIDYIAGDDVNITPLSSELHPNVMNKRGDTIRNQVRRIAKDIEIYGGFALQVNRNLAGEVAGIINVDIRHLRTNKEGDVFFYHEGWGSRRMIKNATVYPAFIPGLEKEWQTLSDEERRRHLSSILYYKSVDTQVYPEPIYAAAVKGCEIERLIANFHINSINNQFVASAIVNFNDGKPSDKLKAEMEEDFNDKYCGSENSGRVMLVWNTSKEHETTITKFDVQDFGDKYKALESHSRQEIFTAFKANPNLFGIPTENKGFSTQEYEEAFRLYNRTQIKPIQRVIAETYETIYGKQGVLVITPFSMDDNKDEKVQ